MLDSYQDLIDELLGSPKIVREALAGGNQQEVQRVVAAMRTRDRLVLERTQLIKNQNDPHLKPMPSQDELLASATGGDDSAQLLDSFEIARGDLVSLLMNLTLKEWNRTATTDADGIVTLSDEIEAHVEFDEEQAARLVSLAG